mmetsp:Transcript_2472/g.5247  ORF Transcript_2472/g.5247 Transcript_2472/m.5247 type:complete len:360 (+) Transcript_2472:323-1402(+)
MRHRPAHVHVQFHSIRRQSAQQRILLPLHLPVRRKSREPPHRQPRRRHPHDRHRPLFVGTVLRRQRLRGRCPVRQVEEEPHLPRTGGGDGRGHVHAAGLLVRPERVGGEGVEGRPRGRQVVVGGGVPLLRHGGGGGVVLRVLAHLVVRPRGHHRVGWPGEVLGRLAEHVAHLPSHGVGLAVDPFGDAGGVGDVGHEFFQAGFRLCGDGVGDVPAHLGEEGGELACRAVAEVRVAGGIQEVGEDVSGHLGHDGARSFLEFAAGGGEEGVNLAILQRAPDALLYLLPGAHEVAQQHLPPRHVRGRVEQHLQVLLPRRRLLVLRPAEVVGLVRTVVEVRLEGVERGAGGGGGRVRRRAERGS